MNRHNISYARNHLSELIARVKEGETVWIVDRQQPVARLEALSRFEAADVDGKISLARRGIMRPARRPLDTKALAALRLPEPGKGAGAVRALLADRAGGDEAGSGKR